MSTWQNWDIAFHIAQLFLKIKEPELESKRMVEVWLLKHSTEWHKHMSTDFKQLLSETSVECAAKGKKILYIQVYSNARSQSIPRSLHVIIMQGYIIRMQVYTTLTFNCH